jgi:hypothetical protein
MRNEALEMIGDRTMHITKEELNRDILRLMHELDVVFTAEARENVKALRQAGMTLSNISEMECNGVPGRDGHMKWDEADQQRADNRRAGAEKRAITALKDMFSAETFKRLHIEFQGDPRGPSIIVGIRGGTDRIVCVW